MDKLPRGNKITSMFYRYIIKTYAADDLANLILDSDPDVEIQRVGTLVNDQSFALALIHDAWMRIDMHSIVYKLKKHIGARGKKG